MLTWKLNTTNICNLNSGKHDLILFFSTETTILKKAFLGGVYKTHF
jgi:hypothetical protein